MNNQQSACKSKELLMPAKSPLNDTSNSLSFNKAALPISNALLKRLAEVLNQHTGVVGDNYIVINFRDKDYSAENGGYHPVEISLSKDAHNHYTILYITDFSFCGGPYPELERDIDFDFGNSAAFTRYGGWASICSPAIVELYPLWEDNFIANLDTDTYDQIEVRGH
ncbi:DUF2787 domain-containing protein [Vibrio sp. 10N.261.45.A4]|uniref:DUF2787 domain-containing protein n=1 Tax=Vibrio sp. 10N.261.45.A4 TaxID=3229655 RepID=UPI00354E5088